MTGDHLKVEEVKLLFILLDYKFFFWDLLSLLLVEWVINTFVIKD